MNKVRETSICRSSSRIADGCVVSRTWNVSCRNVRLITSGARDEPPMPRSTTASMSSTTESANCSRSSASSSMRHGSSSHPSHLPSSLPVQSAASRAQIRSTISVPSATLGGRQLAALRVDVLDDLAERVRELLHAFRLERVGDVVVVDAGGCELLQEPVRLVDPFEHGVAAHLAVILEGADRLERHRVHRLGADQLLDVHDVAVVGVLRRGGRPEAALLRRAFPLEVRPPRVVTREDLQVMLVREL